MNQASRIKRDQRLRRRLLSTLNSTRGSSPTGRIGGRTLVDVVDSVMARDQRFEDDVHALQLCRDLVNKGFATETHGQMRRGERFGLETCEFAVSAAGTSLLSETLPADKDIDDDRLPEAN